MNKKGFTLVELLAVVTIIALISLIAIPNMLNGIKSKKNEISETNKKLLAAATDTYIENNNQKYDYGYEASGSTYCIPIQTLIDNGVLEKPFKNANGEEIDYSNQVQATYQAEYNSFDYEIVENCTEIKQYISRPNLEENMIPVTYDDTISKWVKADKNSHWYNYQEKKWANAVLVREYKSTEQNSKSRYEYKEAQAGTPILESDIIAQFVWIPRFKYQLFESNTQIPINIIFEKYSDSKSTGTQPGQWLTHPAFTYNNQELSGIWIGKYETSNQDNNIIIKQNQTSWTNVNYVEANEKAIQMTNENNIYGLKNVNTHMARNSEWSAAAYLTNSTYGNLNNNSTTGNITGIYNMQGNKEFVLLDNQDENSLGYALNETKNWTTNNSYTTNENIYLTRGNNSIFNYNNSTLADANTTFRIALSNFETQTEDYKNNYMVTFDYNMNLVYGLVDTAETTWGRGKYTISNEKITVTATENDGYVHTPGYVYLEVGKKYIFNCDSDGTWSNMENGDEVEAYILKDGLYTTYMRMPSNNYEFTPTATGTYRLRFDTNQSGKTHSFWNISIKEKSPTKEVTHGTEYGDLPTPTNKPGYTFMGWTQNNLFDKNTTRYKDKSYLNSSGQEAGHDAYAIYKLNVKPNTTYTIINSGGSQAPGYAFYDQNGSFISGDGYRQRGTITITTPSNAATMNFSVVANRLASDEYRYDIDYFQIYEQTVGTVTSSTVITQPQNHTLKGIWKLNT